MSLSMSRNRNAPVNFDKATDGCFKLVHFSRKNLVVHHQRGPEVLAFGSHCSAKFQLIFQCYLPNFKLKYENSEKIITYGVDTVVFNLN